MLRVAQPGELADRRIRLVSRGVAQRHEHLGHPLDRGRVQHRAVVFEAPVQTAIGPQIENRRQIRFRRQRRTLLGVIRRLADAAVQLDAVLQTENRVQCAELTVIGVVRRGEQMIAVVEHLALHRARQLAETLPRVDALHQHRHRDEHAVDPLTARDIAARIRIGAGQLLLAAHAPQPYEVQREQHGRQSHVVRLGNLLQAPHLGRPHMQRQRAVRVGLALQCVERQFGAQGNGVELAHPVVARGGKARRRRQLRRPMAVVEPREPLLLKPACLRSATSVHPATA